MVGPQRTCLAVFCVCRCPTSTSRRVPRVMGTSLLFLIVSALGKGGVEGSGRRMLAGLLLRVRLWTLAPGHLQGCRDRGARSYQPARCQGSEAREAGRKRLAPPTHNECVRVCVLPDVLLTARLFAHCGMECWRGLRFKENDQKYSLWPTCLNMLWRSSVYGGCCDLCVHLPPKLGSHFVGRYGSLFHALAHNFRNGRSSRVLKMRLARPRYP